MNGRVLRTQTPGSRPPTSRSQDKFAAESPEEQFLNLVAQMHQQTDEIDAIDDRIEDCNRLRLALQDGIDSDHCDLLRLEHDNRADHAEAVSRLRDSRDQSGESKHLRDEELEELEAR